MNNANELTKKTCNASFRKLCCRFFVMLLLLFSICILWLRWPGIFPTRLLLWLPRTCWRQWPLCRRVLLQGSKFKSQSDWGRFWGRLSRWTLLPSQQQYPYPMPARFVCEVIILSILQYKTSQLETDKCRTFSRLLRLKGRRRFDDVMTQTVNGWNVGVICNDVYSDKSLWLLLWVTEHGTGSDQPGAAHRRSVVAALVL